MYKYSVVKIEDFYLVKRVDKKGTPSYKDFKSDGHWWDTKDVYFLDCYTTLAKAEKAYYYLIPKPSEQVILSEDLENHSENKTPNKILSKLIKHVLY